MKDLFFLRAGALLSILVVLLLVGLSGCAALTRTAAPVDLEGARKTVAEAQRDPAAAVAATRELERAAQALKQAEASPANTSAAAQWAGVAKAWSAAAYETARARGVEQRLVAAATERERLLRDARVRERDEAHVRHRKSEAQDDLLAEKLRGVSIGRTDRGTVVTLHDVAFAAGKAELPASARRALEPIADAVRDDAARVLLVEGFADAREAPSSQAATLAQRRADAVKQHLVSLGIAATRIVTHGYGALYPVASNDTADGRRQNRRIELLISDEQGLVGSSR